MFLMYLVPVIEGIVVVKTEVDALETLTKGEKFLYPLLAVVPLVRGGGFRIGIWSDSLVRRSFSEKEEPTSPAQTPRRH